MFTVEWPFHFAFVASLQKLPLEYYQHKFLCFFVRKCKQIKETVDFLNNTGIYFYEFCSKTRTDKRHTIELITLRSCSVFEREERRAVYAAVPRDVRGQYGTAL